MLMGLLACENKSASNGNPGADTLAAAATPAEIGPAQVVQDFLRWYKKNETAIQQIQIVKQVEGEPYAVLPSGTEAYLGKLRESGFISELYLKREKDEFAIIEEGYKTNPQTDGPPVGFDYDRVLLSQDWNDLDQVKPALEQATDEKATVLADIGLPLRFSLSKKDGNWWIDYIENSVEGDD